MALRVFILFSEAAEANGTAVGGADVGAVVLSLDGTVVAAVSILIAELTCISTLVLTSAAAAAASAALTSVAAILTSEVVCLPLEKHYA